MLPIQVSIRINIEKNGKIIKLPEIKVPMSYGSAISRNIKVQIVTENRRQ